MRDPQPQPIDPLPTGQVTGDDEHGARNDECCDTDVQDQHGIGKETCRQCTRPLIEGCNFGIASFMGVDGPVQRRLPKANRISNADGATDKDAGRYAAMATQGVVAAVAKLGLHP